MDSADPVCSLVDVAIIVNPRDNVATVRVPLGRGTSLATEDQPLLIQDDIAFGHKFAMTGICSGDSIIKFGDPIGRARRDIAPGEWVHIHNLESFRGLGGQGKRVDQVDSLTAAATRGEAGSSPVLPPLRAMSSARDREPEGRGEFLGYRRPDGSVGVRNYLVILPSVVCAGHVADLIASKLIPPTDDSIAIAIRNQHGCSQLGVDREQTFRTLVGTAANPNVGAALIVGLGCETISCEEIAHEVRKTGKPVETLTIQDAGGTQRTVEKGVELAQVLLGGISSLEREPVDLSELVLGTECGGSDTSSGFSANPAVGYASDLLVQRGGTVVLSETTEFIGAEHLLRNRAVSEELGDHIVSIARRVEQTAIDLGVDLQGANPSPGNIAGGITTIEEKSLGCIYKSGTSPINGAFAYGERIREKGLVIMDTPGNDVVSISGMAAGGVHLVVFTTGRGTPAGAPIVPVIKIATNSGLYSRMGDDLDINAGTIIDGRETIEQVGRRIFGMIAAVASGEHTRAENWGHREFSIGRIAPTF